MGSTRLVIDLGSASKKFGLFSDQTELARAQVEDDGTSNFRGLLRSERHSDLFGSERESLSKDFSEVKDSRLAVTFKHGEQTEHQQWPITDYESAVRKFVTWCIAQGLITAAEEVKVVAIRIVAPGQAFAKHRIIDEAFVAELQNVAAAAPLHINAVLAELSIIKEFLPQAQLQAASDSAFHADLPARARRYAIPESLAEKHDLYRTGYHGLSIASVLRQLKSQLDNLPKRIIVCHLGSGASITAILDGKSIDTSMGMTPLEGVPMHTRVGDIDPGVMLALLSLGDMNRDQVRRILTEESGLKALSGTTGDMKELLEQKQAGDQAAGFAIDVFCYRIRKYIGGYAAALGGLDALILTGTISERSMEIRAEICEPLVWLGVEFDANKNTTIDAKTGGSIQLSSSPVQILVIPTNELAEIARISL